MIVALLSAPGVGAFSRNVTKNLAPQCRALKIEKLKALLFPGLKGAGDTNDWCMIIAISIEKDVVAQKKQKNSVNILRHIVVAFSDVRNVMTSFNNVRMTYFHLILRRKLLSLKVL